MSGTLFVVSTPIGNLEDITLRALRVLREADLIAAEDTRRTAKLLAHHGISTPTTSLHEHNEHRKAVQLVARLAAGTRVALVSDAGTPGVSDPGARLVRAALDADIQIEVIPGPSALTAALAGSGWPLAAVVFAGFPPAREGERARWLERWRVTEAVLVFFEAPHRLVKSLRSMAAAFGPVEAVVAHELTKMHESWHRGRLPALAEMEALPERGEFTILVFNQTTAGGRTTAPPPPADTPVLYEEFCRLTNIDGLGRRDAMVHLARRYALPRREVYAAVERHKKLVT